MKGKDKKALHGKTVAELISLLSQKREELVKTRMELSMNKIKNVHAKAGIRRDIVMIQTVMKQKEAGSG